jgi:chromosome condensin MukBEF ATPase and DNA-binding subunit MukB
MSHGDKIEEEIDKMQSRRNAIHNDLREHRATLSAVSQVALIAEIASIDVHVQEMKKELDDMGWQDFIQTVWNYDKPF